MSLKRGPVALGVAEMLDTSWKIIMRKVRDVSGDASRRPPLPWRSRNPDSAKFWYVCFTARCAVLHWRLQDAAP